ncbi:MAG: hypothetical protein J1E43_04365 [Christensenellaceae bacterium]|nr:hypothetical protein [Christensenellaceae bacterium]
MSGNTKTGKEQKRSERAKSAIFGALVCSGIGILITYIVYLVIFKYIIGKVVTFVFGAISFLLLLIAISSYFDLKEAKRIEKIEEDAAIEEKEFSQIDPSKRALRAEKLFKINQKELMRYYDMNIAQTKFLSTLGIIMILFGIGIVALSCVAYVYLDTDKLLLIIGNVSGVIVDSIGAIFIKMYTQNLEAAVQFHAKFAESNNLLLANSIANKIENEDLRETTLSDISKAIVSIGHGT